MKYKVMHLFASAVKGGAERATIFLADNLEKTGKVENIIGLQKGHFYLMRQTD